jgi:hypothetical protein
MPYTVKLTVDGHRYERPLTIVPDPRVKVTAAALAAQFRLEQRLVAGLTASYEGINYVARLRSAIDSIVSRPQGTMGADRAAARARALDSALAPIAASTRRARCWMRHSTARASCSARRSPS